MLRFFSNLPRKQKQILVALSDVIVLPLAFWMALCLRLSSWNPLRFVPQAEVLLYAIPVIAVGIFIPLGLYRTVIRYSDEKTSRTIVLGVTLTVLALALVVVMGKLTGIPRSSFVIFWGLANGSVMFTRVAARRVLRDLDRRLTVQKRQKIAIYGAGKAGAQLAMGLSSSPEFQVKAFFDDNPDLHGAVLFGVRVYSPEKARQVIADYDLQGLILALPSAPRHRRADVIQRFEKFGLSLKTLPGMAELVGGKVRVEDLREVGIEDLLGRDPVPPNEVLLSTCIENKSVMVTGAGGSIGSELCLQILSRKPSKLVLYDVSEYALYMVEQQLRRYLDGVEIFSILGDVKNPVHLEATMRTHGVQTIYHAAAYKHVPIVEWNTIAGLENNALGTFNAAKAAINTSVETFVLVSTDKAVRPTNVMGASKRLAEMILQALSAEKTGTRFCMVRFGNVLGSSGSVVPLFKEQIRRGGPVTVTHLEVTRFFMTIPEAAQLVLQAGAMGKGGDVFVLDMGESVKIYDLAVKMIQLSGLSVRNESYPDGDISIEISGLRPGEKLYEELLIGENVSSTEHSRILRAEERFLVWNELRPALDELARSCKSQDEEAARQILRNLVVEYAPSLMSSQEGDPKAVSS